MPYYRTEVVTAAASTYPWMPLECHGPGSNTANITWSKNRTSGSGDNAVRLEFTLEDPSGDVNVVHRFSVSTQTAINDVTSGSLYARAARFAISINSAGASSFNSLVLTLLQPDRLI